MAAMNGDRWEPPEPWITKQQLADHLAVTRRWIELQQHRGLPHTRMGGINRYRISEVEAWLREHYNSPAEGD
jgi:phage terminase Nu1 subunit (DNA packaging protein)